jgi:DNA/RNA-binding domain of Phe-tRNA-synthetase-like protein
MIYVDNALPRNDALLGIVRAEGVQGASAAPGFAAKLAALIEARQGPLRQDEEAVRQAARDLLRNGSYKPTGRGKPASEYLVRAAQQGEAGFPRINPPVDVANYMSLKTLFPISLWDLDRAGTDHFLFRLGQPGEAYAFNTAGQEIRLEDLIVGCRLAEGAETGRPIVNPVKDSLATKTTDETRRVAACVYAPRAVVSLDDLRLDCAEFAALLAACSGTVEVTHAVVEPGETVRL